MADERTRPSTRTPTCSSGHRARDHDDVGRAYDDHEHDTAKGVEIAGEATADCGPTGMRSWHSMVLD